MSEMKRPPADPRRGPFDTEINTRAVVGFVFWLVLGVAIVAGGMWMFQSRLEKRAQSTDEAPSPLVDRTQRRLPPEPRLQTTPELDLQAYRREERRRAASWGWIDEKTGVVHIPVERALEIVAARGLPAHPSAGSAPSLPLPAAPPGGQP